jgi:hypothetical protein
MSRTRTRRPPCLLRRSNIAGSLHQDALKRATICFKQKGPTLPATAQVHFIGQVHTGSLDRLSMVDYQNGHPTLRTAAYSRSEALLQLTDCPYQLTLGWFLSTQI